MGILAFTKFTHRFIAVFTVRLEPKVSLLLKLLLQADGEVMTREQLCDALWTDTIVSDDSENRLSFALLIV